MIAGSNLAKVGTMRGYFGIGVAGVSKSMNVGSLFRTAHAFGASYVFTVGAAYARRVGRGVLRAASISAIWSGVRDMGAAFYGNGERM